MVKLLPGPKKSGPFFYQDITMNPQDILRYVDSLHREKNIDPEIVFQAIEAALVSAAKRQYGDRIAVLGGIDMDFLCWASEEQVRQRVRDTLERCMPGGGYCLGTGNSAANYIPLENYLAMLDEGRKFKV